jgi:hypothetical protein
MHYIKNGETPTEWKNRIWDRLMYFRREKIHMYEKEDCFYAYKESPHLVDGQKYFKPCGIAICFSCDQLVYLGISRLSTVERREYNALEGKYTTTKSRNISFNGKCGMYQHWATACTGNKFCNLNYKDYMEMGQLIPSDDWMAFHKYDLQMMNPFGKFSRGVWFMDISNYVHNKFGNYAEQKLHRYVLWLANVTRRIRHIRQKRVFLNALQSASTARQKEFYQIANNAREMHPPCINRQVWMDKPYEVPYGRSLTPPPLPPKPVALMGGLERYPMRRSASAPEISAYRFERSRVLIDAEEYFNSVRNNANRR